jgi:hypothetical protein
LERRRRLDAVLERVTAPGIDAVTPINLPFAGDRLGRTTIHVEGQTAEQVAENPH